MPLPPFEEEEVRSATVKITGAGDGLSDALDVDPIALHYGDTVTYVIKTSVEQVNHRPIDAKKPELGLTRQHTLKVQEITEIDGKVAEEFLEEGRKALDAKRPVEQKKLGDD